MPFNTHSVSFENISAVLVGIFLVFCFFAGVASVAGLVILFKNAEKRSRAIETALLFTVLFITTLVTGIIFLFSA